MKDEVERQLQVMIDQASTEELANIAASAFEAWCQKVGVDHSGVHAFVHKLVEEQFADEPRNLLIEVLTSYKAPDWAKN